MKLNNLNKLAKSKPKRFLAIASIDFACIISLLFFNYFAVKLYPKMPGLSNSLGPVFVTLLIFYLLIWYLINASVWSFFQLLVMKQSFKTLKVDFKSKGYYDMSKKSVIIFSPAFIEALVLIFLLGFSSTLQEQQTLAFLVILIGLIILMITLVFCYYWASMLHSAMKKGLEKSFLKTFDVSYYKNIIGSNFITLTILIISYLLLGFWLPMINPYLMAAVLLIGYYLIVINNRLSFIRL